MTEITPEQRGVLFDRYPDATWILARCGWAAVHISDDDIAWHRFGADVSLGDQEPGPEEWEGRNRELVKSRNQILGKYAPTVAAKMAANPAAKAP